jgi:hypothetical protein
VSPKRRRQDSMNAIGRISHLAVWSTGTSPGPLGNAVTANVSVIGRTEQ